MSGSTASSPQAYGRGAALLVLFLLARSARGEEDFSAAGPDEIKRACVAEHETAQLLRRAGKLTEARATILACAQDSCPSVISADCAGWLDAVAASIPSVIVSASTGSRVEDNVSVTVDGKVVTSRLDGRPMELDPGLHTFRFDALGRESVEQEVILAEGEKGRPLHVAFSAPEPHEANEVVPETRRPMPMAAYVLGGVAAVGIGIFSGFGLSGLNERTSLQSSCSPSCSSSQIRSVRAKFLVADVGLGAAVLSLAAGTYAYLRRPEVQSKTMGQGRYGAPPSAGTTVALLPTSSAVLVSVQGAF